MKSVSEIPISVLQEIEFDVFLFEAFFAETESDFETVSEQKRHFDMLDFKQQ